MTTQPYKRMKYYLITTDKALENHIPISTHIHSDTLVFITEQTLLNLPIEGSVDEKAKVLGAKEYTEAEATSIINLKKMSY